jgi:hypothetical protein
VKIKWLITTKDKARYLAFIKKFENSTLVKDRRSRNVRREGIVISKKQFWRTLVSCFLTTQQRSGKGSSVSKFLHSGSPLLSFDNCRLMANAGKTAQQILSQNGIRRNELIAKEMEYAIEVLDSGWGLIKKRLQTIYTYPTAKKERKVARLLISRFKGLGPKQSRNLIQWLGLSRYEIPLDSRIVKVLGELGFPVPLSSTALADENYYCFVEDGIQRMMKEIDVYPCIFDACAFESLER